MSILLGRGDGSFRAPILIPVGFGPWGVAVGDFTDNGILDLAVTNRTEDTISILLGNGDGTFRPGRTLITGVQPSYITAADLSGDGHLDLVESNFYSDSISIFYGNGDGTFQSPVTFTVGSQPGNPVVADFNGDGRSDIAVVSCQSEVSILMATGPKTYAPPLYFPAGPGANLMAAGDLTGNGKTDLVVADSGSFGPSYVTILMNNGDGTFSPSQSEVGGVAPYSVALADLTGNGVLDIVTGNLRTNDLTALMGNGDGTFDPPIEIPNVPSPYGLVIAALTVDGNPDIVVADYQSDHVTVILNQGGGVFSTPQQILTGGSQIPVVSADFTGSGVLDLAVANPLNNTVTIQMGNGDATFTPGETIPVGIDPSGLATGDFNGDGRPDLAVACAGSDEVMVMLGLGDGTFTAPVALPVGFAPHSIVTGDFLNNGITDIAVADENSNDVAILYGRGNGTFEPAKFLTVGDEPVSLVAVDLNGNGLTDLVTANRTSGNLTILWNLGAGDFQAQTVHYGGDAPITLGTADLVGNGGVELAVADEDGYVSVFMNLGAPPVSVYVGQAATILATVPISGPGGPEALATASINSQSSYLLGIPSVLGLGNDGSPENVGALALAVDPAGFAFGSFNGDGINDVALSTFSSNQVVVQLGTTSPNPSQQLSTQVPVPLPNAQPIITDWNGDGIPEVFTLNQQGQLLEWFSQPGSPYEYDQSQVIGQDLGVSFQSIALVNTPNGPVVAALQSGAPVIWLFSHGDSPNAPIREQPITVPDAGQLVSMTAGDLDHDGLDDLVLVDQGNSQLIVLYQEPDGSFGEEWTQLAVESGAADVAIINQTGDPWPELAVTNTYSGDISIYQCGPGRQFGPEIVLAAGLGAAQVVAQGDGDGQVVQSDDDPLGLTSGVFDSSGLTDIVTVQSGTDRISLLDGTTDGEFADPSLATSYTTDIDPTQVVTASLTGNGFTDLVVLNKGSDDISIFLNNGKGGFIAMPPVAAGDDPTGVAVRDLSGNGIPDLLVSNAMGDLLVLIGNGDGTFKPYQPVDQTVSLAVGDFSGNGQTEFVLSNTSINELTVEYGATQSFVQGQSDGLKAPGAVAVADLTGNGREDIILVNQGENDIVIYLGLGGNRFAAPLCFYTGSDPVGVTVADLTGNGVPDLIVANEGSNDLSVFVGEGQGANWQLVPGPRLRVGEQPVSTTVADVSGDGVPDIICVDKGSNDVVVLRGVGGGFFADNQPLVLPTGQSPIRAFVGKFDAAPGPDLVVLDSGSNDLTYYSNFISGISTPMFIPTGGVDPVAGVMGDFSNNGYDDLVIANNGDNRITLFEGSPGGLVLTDSETLNQSVRPTDLVISGADPGQLFLDVSAQGRNEVFPVTLALMASGVGAGGANPSTLATSSQSGAPRGSLFSGGGLFSFDLLSTETGTQEQVCVSAATPSSSPTASSGQVALATATVLATLDQMISLSSVSLPGVLSNLVHMGQVQIADIMPLGNSAIETVAVLLVVSSTSVEHSNGFDAASPEEFQPAAWAGVELELPRGRHLAASASNLEQYLLDLGGDLDDVARDVLGTTEEQTGAPPPWDLRPSASGTVDVTLAGAGGPVKLAGTLNRGPASRPPPERDPGADVALSIPSGLDEESPQPLTTADAVPGWLGWMGLFCGTLVIWSVLTGWKAARKQWRAGRFQPTVRQMPTIAGPHATDRWIASNSLGSRASRVQDPPPWLARPR